LDRQDEGIKGEDPGRHGRVAARRWCGIPLATIQENERLSGALLTITHNYT